MDKLYLIILGLLILDVVFLIIIGLMKVRINMLSRELNELKGRMEFSDNDIDLLADAIRGLGGTRF